MLLPGALVTFLPEGLQKSDQFSLRYNPYTGINDFFDCSIVGILRAMSIVLLGRLLGAFYRLVLQAEPLGTLKAPAPTAGRKAYLLIYGV